MLNTTGRWSSFTPDELHALLDALRASDADASLVEDEARIAGRLKSELRLELRMLRPERSAPPK